ncbi:MAG: hypothetical protein J6S85_13000, partial [Methanobrevibacter sp.]|nr:hypothetical protein [Methanobrevibacter sp.]
MSYTSFDFPHTHFYDSDLRELLGMCKTLMDDYNKLVADLNSLNEWRIKHEGEYEELVVKLSEVEQELSDFEVKLNKEFADLDAALQAKFNDLVNNVNAELEAALKTFTELYNTLRTQIESEFATIKVEIARAIVQLQNLIAANNEYVFEEVARRLEEFIQNLPDYENLIVYNPVRGSQTNVQTAILDLYDEFRIYGLTAAQYDSLQLTASHYDSLNLTALEYDRMGYKLLDYPDPTYSMRDPFDGQFVKCQVVIYKLADLHRDCLTAAEY